MTRYVNYFAAIAIIVLLVLSFAHESSAMLGLKTTMAAVAWLLLRDAERP